MPPGLRYPEGTDFWAPFVPSRLNSEHDTTAYTALDLVGRLAPGATPQDAATELGSYLGRIDTSRKLRGASRPFTDAVLGNTRIAVVIVAAAAALLLLITCLDVANLLLVRGVARVREIAIRGALGGSRARIVAGLMWENALIAIAGGSLGVVVASVCVDAFRAFAPASVPLLEEHADSIDSTSDRFSEDKSGRRLARPSAVNAASVHASAWSYTSTFQSSASW
jgi:uncharacterized membrane protein